MDIRADQFESVRRKAGYRLAVEVMRVTELRGRAAADHFSRPHRVEFFMLMAVTQGRTVHTIDFASVPASASTWILVRPSQIQRFDFSRKWDGWVVVFRTEILPPESRQQSTPFQLRLASDIEMLPSSLHLARGAHRLGCASIAQIAADARLGANEEDRNALMLYQLCALITRLRP